MVRLEHRQNWNGRRPYTAVLTVMSVNVSRCGQAEYKSSQPIMTPRELGHRLFLVVLIVMLGLGLAGAQTLAIHGDQFAVNGQSKFLIFVSYFDAMRRAGVDGQGLVTDFAFLEAKTEAGQVFNLAADFAGAVQLVPEDRPWRRLLRLRAL